MIDFSNTIITECTVHTIGNKTRGEHLKLSANLIELEDELEIQLRNFFLLSFQNKNELFQFHHEIDLKMNEIFVTADNIFEKEDFLSNSINIAKHLFNSARHPLIKSGELFIAQMEEVLFDKTICKAVGIFKSERKDSFFKVNDSKKNFEIIIDSGIAQHKLDKGCLILNTKYREGFIVLTHEIKNADTDYWRNDFLSIKQKQDNYFFTKNLMDSCKDFVTQQYPEDFETTKADQIDLLNRSVEYFKTHETFEQKEFEKEVLHHKNLIQSFQNFNEQYAQENNIEINDGFEISAHAVKKQARVFKSVLKLDKNFHVYIHGNREMIEQGVDADGRKYYKLYFENEA